MSDRYHLSMTEFLDKCDKLLEESDDDYIVIEIEKRGTYLIRRLTDEEKK